MTLEELRTVRTALKCAWIQAITADDYISRQAVEKAEPIIEREIKLKVTNYVTGEVKDN